MHRKKKEIVTWLLSFQMKWNQFSVVMERNVFLENIKGLYTSFPCPWQFSKGCLSGCLTPTIILANFFPLAAGKFRKEDWDSNSAHIALTCLKKQIVRGPMRNPISLIWIPFLLPKLWSDAGQKEAGAVWFALVLVEQQDWAKQMTN